MCIAIRFVIFSILISTSLSFAGSSFFHNDNPKLKIYLNNFLAMSCDKTGNLCLALGAGEDSQIANLSVYKTQDAGLNWSSPISLLPVATETKFSAGSASISCDSTGQRCVVVNSAKIGRYPAPVVYSTQDGGLNWSEPTVLKLPSTARKLYMKVSCVDSGTSCMIAGAMYGVNNRGALLLYTTKDVIGHQWAFVTTLREPAGTRNHQVTLSNVSCDQSGLFCMAVGSAVIRGSFWGIDYSSKPLVYTTEDGGAHWGDPVVLPTKILMDQGSGLGDVACSVTGRQCTVLGSTYDVNTNLVQHYSFTTMNGGLDWEPETVISPFDLQSSLISLGCDDMGINCTTVGGVYPNDASQQYRPLIYSTTDSAKTWTKNEQVLFPPYSYLVDIFCSKVDDSCITVGFLD